MIPYKGGKMLTIQEFAKFMKVHENTVRKWIENGMPTVKFDAVIRIDQEKAIAWLENHKD